MIIVNTEQDLIREVKKTKYEEVKMDLIGDYYINEWKKNHTIISEYIDKFDACCKLYVPIYATADDTIKQYLKELYFWKKILFTDED